jgi:glucose-1-phosphate thymidylyltransferase
VLQFFKSKKIGAPARKSGHIIAARARKRQTKSMFVASEIVAWSSNRSGLLYLTLFGIGIGSAWQPYVFRWLALQACDRGINRKTHVKIMLATGREAGIKDGGSAMRKGIILAGGSGTRLYPLTRAVSKQLMAVYDKPMIYYPLSVLMLAGIRQILIITTPHEQPGFKRLLGDGSTWGLELHYAAQPSPDGLAQAFLIGREFLGGAAAALVLGDNIFYGHGLPRYIQSASDRETGATIFAYQVRDPERYGVVSFDSNGKAQALQEKPAQPLSSYAVPGLYFYDSQVSEVASRLKPSPRGELEITDLNLEYLHAGQLHVEKFGRGIAWLDTGTHESLLQASVFIQTIQDRQGLMVSCLEEIALKKGFIDASQVRRVAETMKGNEYGRYLLHLLETEA